MMMNHNVCAKIFRNEKFLDSVWTYLSKKCRKSHMFVVESHDGMQTHCHCCLCWSDEFSLIWTSSDRKAWVRAACDFSGMRGMSSESAELIPLRHAIALPRPPCQPGLTFSQWRHTTVITLSLFLYWVTYLPLTDGRNQSVWYETVIFVVLWILFREAISTDSEPVTSCIHVAAWSNVLLDLHVAKEIRDKIR